MNRREFTLASLGVVTTSLAGCSQLDGVLGNDSVEGQVVDNWGAYRGDAARTGRVAAEEGPGESLSVAWQLTIEDLVDEFESGVATDGIEFSATSRMWSFGPVLTAAHIIWTTRYTWEAEGNEQDRYRIIGLEPSGSIVWSHELPIPADDRVYAGPTLDDGVLYQRTNFEQTLGSEAGTGPTDDAEGTTGSVGVTVFDPASGDVERELDLSLPTSAMLVVDDGTIFATATSDGSRYISAFDATSGSERWSVEATPTPYIDRPFCARTDETIVYASYRTDSTALVARSVEDGSVSWRTPIEQPDSARQLILASPTVVGDVYTAGYYDMYQGGAGAPLVSVSTDDGTIQSQYKPPAIEDPDNPRFDSWDAEYIEERAGYSGLYGMPLPLDDLVVATGYGAVGNYETWEGPMCMGIKDGSVAWTADTGFAMTPVAAGDVIYLNATNGVWALSTDGDVLDSIEGAELGSPWGLHPPAIGHGRLYVPTASGLAAIE